MNKNKKDGADSVIGSWPKAQGSDPAQVSKLSKIDELYESIQGPKEVAPSSTESLQGPTSTESLSGPPPSSSSSSESLKGPTPPSSSSLRGPKDAAPPAPAKKEPPEMPMKSPEKAATPAPAKKEPPEMPMKLRGPGEVATPAPAKKEPPKFPTRLRGPDEPSSEKEFALSLQGPTSTESLSGPPPSSSSSSESLKGPTPPSSSSLRGPKEVAPSSSESLQGPTSFYSELPQRSAKDSLPKTPESSSPMTNTPKIDEAQDVFPFQRMNVSEISQLLELPKNLHSLKIEGCDVLDNIPERVMASIPSLQRLYIINCCSLKSFPEPADLRILHIQNCKKLEFPPPAGKTNQYAFLEHLCIGNSCDSLTFLPLDLFPKLRCLSIWDCQNLISLSIQEGNQKDLTSLEALEIRDCPDLVNFPEGGLPTPNLTSIWLSNCNLKELPLQLRTTLTSLRSIFISKCPELVSLFKGDSASNLSLLSITSCDKLMPMREWGLHMLKCLIKLEIEGGCEDLESFPEEKLLPSKLKSLRVSRLLNLKSLDYKGLQHLTALKTLEISCCAKLESLPEEGLPSSLSVLCIKECSLLKPQLQKQTGDYWPKIARISFIETDKEVISRKSPRSKQ